MSFGSFFQTVSTHEVLMFIAVFTLFVLLGMFFHYNTVQLRVQKESKCLQESQLAKTSGVYTAVAKVLNRPAFQVSYDTLDKSSKIECACADGEAESVFTNIPYYDLRSTTADKDRVQYKDKLICNCESNLTPSLDDDPISYYGEPGVTRFMYDQKNTGFFDTLLYGPDYEYVNK